MTKRIELELTDDQIERNDDIDNAVFECITILAEQPTMEWDMQLIGETTDAIKETLSNFDIRVRHPGIREIEGGVQVYCEYDDDDKEDTIGNLNKNEMYNVLNAYNKYIQDANEEDRYSSGWYPVCIEEFYQNEYKLEEDDNSDNIIRPNN